MKAINSEKTLKSAQSLQVNFGILSKPLIDAVVEIINQQEIIDVVLLDKIKQTRERIEQLKHKNTDIDGYRWWNNAIDNCLHELDSIIESEN